MKTKMLFFTIALIGFQNMSLADQTYALAKKNKVHFIAKITGGSFDTNSSEAEGSLTLDDAGQKIKSATISVPVKSLDSALSMRNDHMQKKYLEVSKFPNITFNINQADIELNPQTTVKGEFSIHGVQKTVEIPVTTSKTDKTVSIKSQFPISILDYGIEQPKFAVVKMDPEVQLDIDLTFEKK